MSRRRGTTAFSPSSLTNLRAWYKSDVGITIATGVSQWNDQSGNGNHLVQATGGAQPVVTAAAINGLPAITFDGVDDRMAVAFALVQPITVFAVVRQDTWVSTRYLWDGATSDTMRCFQQTATPGISIAAGSTIGPNNNLAVATFGLITAVYDGASGALQINSTAETAGAIGAGNGGGITLGARANGTVPGNIAFAEVIVMAANATAGERASMRAYSQARYGVGA